MIWKYHARESLEKVKPGAANKGMYSYYRSPEEVKMDKRREELNSRQIQPSVLTSLISGCQKLERLALAGYCVPDPTGLRQLGQFPKLLELDVSRVTTLKPADADQTEGQSSCQYLDSADLAEGLSGCPLLERLSVAGLKAPVEQLVPPTGLPKLTHLDASESGLTNNSLRRLPGLFPGLQTLNIQGCRSVHEDGLVSYLPRLRCLRSLDLMVTSGVSNVMLEALKKCPLTKLRLGDNGYHVSSNGLVRLVLACPSLKSLVLEESDRYAVHSTEDHFRQHLPLHRVILLGFPKIKNDTQKQIAPLFVQYGDAVNWSESGV